MKEDSKQLIELAGRIYDLDTEVYRVLGSGLGRVFSGSRTACLFQTYTHFALGLNP